MKNSDKFQYSVFQFSRKHPNLRFPTQHHKLAISSLKRDTIQFAFIHWTVLHQFHRQPIQNHKIELRSDPLKPLSISLISESPFTPRSSTKGHRSLKRRKNPSLHSPGHFSPSFGTKKRVPSLEGVGAMNIETPSRVNSYSSRPQTPAPGIQFAAD